MTIDSDPEDSMDRKLLQKWSPADDPWQSSPAADRVTAGDELESLDRNLLIAAGWTRAVGAGAHIERRLDEIQVRLASLRDVDSASHHLTHESDRLGADLRGLWRDIVARSLSG
jgi:hypothetical protein